MTTNGGPTEPSDEPAALAVAASSAADRDTTDPVRLPPRFEVKRLIGQGGMARVFEAHDRELGRDVAVKLLFAERLGDADSRTRFRREARAAASLSHPHIVTVHDIAPDARYIVMELIRGETLRDRIRVAGKLPPGEVRRIAAELLAALGAAHRAGVVHRDVKPANVLLESDGTVRLADFGIASFGDSELTSTGAQIGTPAYMSPEQLRGRRVDARADVYAAGATLFEAATGTRLHQPEGAVERPHRAVLEATGDETLARAIARAVRERPADRFEDANELARAIEAEPTRTQRAPRYLLLTAVALVCMCLGGLLAYRLFRKPTFELAVKERPTLVVLPFVVDSKDPRLDFASFGLPHLLGGELRRAPELSVIDYYRLRDAIADDAASSEMWIQTAAALGATVAVRGELRSSDSGRVQISLTIMSMSGEVLSRIVRDADVQRVPAAIRELVNDIIEAATGKRGLLRTVRDPTFEADRELELGIAALEVHELSKADAHLQAALNLSPDLPEAHYQLAVVTWWHGATSEKILAQIGRADAVTTDEDRVSFLAGLRLLVENEYPRAIEHFRAASARFADNRDLRYGLFEALFHGGRPAEAMTVYGEILHRAPRFRLAFMHPLDYFLSRNDERGLLGPTSVAAMSEQDPGWHLKSLLARRDYPGALARAESILSQPGTSPPEPAETTRLLLQLAGILALSGRLDQAIQTAEDPRAAHDAFWRAEALWALYAASGNAREAARWRELALGQAALVATKYVHVDRLSRLAAMDVGGGDRNAVAEDRVVLRVESSEREKKSLRYQVADALLVAALDDISQVDRLRESPFPEVQAIADALGSQGAGRLSEAADAWRRALDSSHDGHSRIAEWLMLARTLERARDWPAVLAACDEVTRPRQFNWSWGPATASCRSFSDQARAALGKAQPR